MTLAPSVRFDSVRKEYRRGRRVTEALRSLSLTLGPGEIAALVGPNGSGKTTALRIAATLVTASSGSCTVCGYDVQRHPGETRRAIGVSLGSERAFYWRLSAERNLSFFCRVAGLGRSRTQEAIARVAAELDIERFLSRPARQLSRGVLARLAVARACLGEPAVLVLDEPFASVDDRGKELLWRLLRRRADAGRSVLLATHDADLAGRCDVVAEVTMSAAPRR